jgi:hypothetical protein
MAGVPYHSVETYLARLVRKVNGGDLRADGPIFKEGAKPRVPSTARWSAW